MTVLRILLLLVFLLAGGFGLLCGFFAVLGFNGVLADVSVEENREFAFQFLQLAGGAAVAALIAGFGMASCPPSKKSNANE